MTLRSSTNSPFVDNRTPTPDQANAAYLNQVGDEVNAKYVLPGTGIPKTDMATAVQTSLGKADSATQPGGTDVLLADGGTGASLTAPGADRLMFYDQSASAVAFLTPGAGLTITGTTLDAAGGAGSTVINNGDGTLTFTTGSVNNGDGTLTIS